jgi:hypothetical protein
MHLEPLISVVLSRPLAMIVSTLVSVGHYRSRISFMYPHLAPQARVLVSPNYIA